MKWNAALNWDVSSTVDPQLISRTNAVTCLNTQCFRVENQGLRSPESRLARGSTSKCRLAIDLRAEFLLGERNRKVLQGLAKIDDGLMLMASWQQRNERRVGLFGLRLVCSGDQAFFRTPGDWLGGRGSTGDVGGDWDINLRAEGGHAWPI